MIQEITEFIEDQAGLTRDTDLFAGHRPQESADACDVVIESAGGPVYWWSPNRADILIQVLSRAKTYLTARARAYAIYDAIYRDYSYGSAGWTLPIVTVGQEYEAMMIEPLAIPQWIGFDEKGRYEFSVNYIFRIMKL